MGANVRGVAGAADAEGAAGAETKEGALTVSVVVPCYKSAATIGKVVRLTREELVSAGFGYEFVLVNDGSPDDGATFRAIRELCAEDPQVKGIDLLRNFGQHGAIMAGLNQTRGDLVLLMDDDMQTHPSQVRLLLDKVFDGYDVVFARYEGGPKESPFRRAGSAFAEWTEHLLASSPKGIYASSFFVMRDYVRDEVISYTGPYPYIEGLVFRTTRNVANVTVQHFEREVGTSGYTLKALVRLWSTMLGLSVLPLRVAAVAGGALSLAGLLWALVIVVQRLSGAIAVEGWASTMAVMLLCFGIVLMFLGLIGEYLGRLSLMVSAHPQFEVRSALNVEGGVDQDARFVRPTGGHKAAAPGARAAAHPARSRHETAGQDAGQEG